MTDSHCHLSHPPLVSNLKHELELFVKSGGVGILNVSGDLKDIPEVINQKIKLNQLYPDLIKSGIGIHPEYLEGISMNQVIERIEKFEAYVEEYAKELNAIGETGLDYHNLPQNIEETKQAQKTSFRRHILKAKKHNLPLSVHSWGLNESSECIKDTLELLIEAGEGKITGSLHSYTGPADYIPKILEAGFYVGFNAIITYKSGENVRDNLKETPLDRILLETDGPWLSIRDKDAPKYGTPRNVKRIAETVAEVKECSIEKVLRQTDENFMSLFA